MATQPKAEYHISLAAFIDLLTQHQRRAAEQKGLKTIHIFAFLESGRKFDKIMLRNENGTAIVRYFVDRTNGNIYGAKSPLAPNFKWYFGDIYRSNKWEWGDLHGRPINDTEIRATKGYGPYTHYMKV